MTTIKSLLDRVNNHRFAKYVDDPQKTISPYLVLSNLYDNPDFRKRELFIENHNALKAITDLLIHKDCRIKSIILKYFMLDDGTNSSIENYTSHNDFKVFMNAIQKNNHSIKGLTIAGSLSNRQVHDLCSILPRVDDGRQLVYLKLTKECVNDEQLEKVLISLQNSSLRYLHVTENKFRSGKTGRTFKKVLPKLLHLRDFMFYENYPLGEYSSRIDNFLFLRSQRFREDFRIAVSKNISLCYVRTDFDMKELYESFMESPKISREIKNRAEETRQNLNGMVNCNFRIQQLYDIYKKNRGIRQMGLSDKQTRQSIRYPNKELLPLDIRTYIYEFVPNGLMDKGGIASFIQWTESFRDAMAKIVREVPGKKRQRNQKMKYIQQNFQHLGKEDIKFLLSLDEIYSPFSIWTYIDLMLDKIYCYARENNIFSKTKDGAFPKFKKLKLHSLDQEGKVVRASRKRKRQE